MTNSRQSPKTPEELIKEAMSEIGDCLESFDELAKFTESSYAIMRIVGEGTQALTLLAGYDPTFIEAVSSAALARVREELEKIESGRNDSATMESGTPRADTVESEVRATDHREEWEQR